MPEVWKDIKDYEGLYQISNYGRIRSLNKTKGRIRKQSIQRGYYYIWLSKNSKGKMYIVHRLVAQHFIPNPLHLPEVNHKDENKLNNNVDNLEWCDAKYNSNYGTRNERKGKPIQCIETGKIYWGARELERQTGILHNNIAKAIRNNTITGGYHWQYVEKKGDDYLA